MHSIVLPVADDNANGGGPRSENANGLYAADVAQVVAEVVR